MKNGKRLLVVALIGICVMVLPAAVQGEMQGGKGKWVAGGSQQAKINRKNV